MNALCIGDPIDYGNLGLGNQLMTTMSNALLAYLFGRCLVVRSPLLRAAFDFPEFVHSSFPHGRSILELPVLNGRKHLITALVRRDVSYHYQTRWWHAKNILNKEITDHFNVTTVEKAMHAVGAVLFSSPSRVVSLQTNALMKQHSLLTAVHLRTFADSKCPLPGRLTYGDCGQCVPKRTIRCIRTLAFGPAVIFGDNPTLVARVARDGDVNESSFFGQTSKTLTVSTIKSGYELLDPVVIWNTLRLSKVRVGSSGSTFSKSAMLVSGIHTGDILVDLRCQKTFPSDGDLFACRSARWTDLV